MHPSQIVRRARTDHGLTTARAPRPEGSTGDPPVREADPAEQPWTPSERRWRAFLASIEPEIAPKREALTHEGVAKWRGYESARPG